MTESMTSDYSWEASLADLKIGFGLTGSHCTLNEAILAMAALRGYNADIMPIISEAVAKSDTKFGRADYWQDQILEICAPCEIIDTIVKAEPIGPKKLLDLMIIAPCTGNTLAKLAAGITDSPVLMAAKAHLRNGRPLVLAIATNDGLGANAKNIGYLLNCKHIYFVPFGQDDALQKPNSLIADMTKVPISCAYALKNRQVQPLLLK